MTTDTPDFIDALPYIDTAIDDDEELRNSAMKEVDDEIDVFPPDKDYLEYLPPLEPRTFSTPLIECEHSCIDRNELRPPSYELANIRTETPPATSSIVDDEELATWSKCLNQMIVKLEYLQRQMVNLELIKNQGETEWKQCIEDHERLESGLREELNQLSKKIQEVNWKRKSDQEHTYKVLELLRSEWT